ncbi:unnamed protein product [Rhizophagus irregularis]|nr:unnamed protein product [Rhizophagus irregularis]
MPYNYESELSKALGQLLKIETDYNVIIHIGELPNFKEFHAHSNILRCRSEYFDKILSAENIEKKDGKYLIKKPNISPQAFNVILKYLYTSQIDITNKTGTELLNFMIVSNELMLKNLTKFIEDFIIENQQQFLQNDPIGIFQIIYYCKSLVNLQEYCLDMICSEPEILFKSDKFTQLPAPLLEIILKRDDLNLEEIKIWENLIKWGLAQEQVLNQDVSKWIGGYNPLQWDLSGYKSTKDSFVFLLTDRTNLQTAKVGYSNGDEYSIVCDSHTLPFFGYNNLYLQNSSWICSPVKENGQYSYPELDGMKGTYDVDDYEVFQVMKQ